MTNEHDEELPEQEFPPLNENAEFDEEVEQWYDEYEPQPELAAEPLPEDPSAFVTETPIESEGVLFPPEDDPLVLPPMHGVPAPEPVRPPYVSRRLRHLISEPKQAIIKEPSRRHWPGRG